MDTYRGEDNDPSSLHLYSYCAANPVNFIDPSGHFFWKVIGAATVGTTAYKLGKKYGLKGWKLALCTAAGGAIGAVAGAYVSKLLKPVMKVFLNPKSKVVGTKVGRYKISMHGNHHKKGIHFVLEKKTKAGKWRKKIEKAFKKK